MDPQRWRRFFEVAAVFNVMAGLPLILVPAMVFATFGVAPLADYLFVQVSGSLILTYGLGYWFVSRDLTRRELVLLGVIGKTGVVVLLAMAWAQGRLPTLAAAAGLGDVLFVVGFARFLITTAGRSAQR